MIPIHPVQINSTIPNGTYWSLKNILFILISKLAYGNLSVLQIGDVIHIKLSGDGHQVGKHHNHLIFIACMLNKHDAVLSSSNQYCIFLYNGVKQYEVLQKALSFLIDELIVLNKE
ncbi:3354_t:CDS:1, partial [Dentiscutata erythropus]